MSVGPPNPVPPPTKSPVGSTVILAVLTKKVISTESEDEEEPPLFPDVIDASKSSKLNWFGIQQHQSEIIKVISGKDVVVKCTCGSTYEIGATAALSFVYHGLFHCFACDMCNKTPEFEYINDFGV